MRYLNSPIWDIWAGGQMDGPNRPNGAVTVEPGWWLTTSYSTNSFGGKRGPGIPGGGVHPAYPINRGPIRWWQNADNDQHEIPVPQIQTINIDRSISQDVATCTITLINAKMRRNTSGNDRASDIGAPGYYSLQRGGIRYQTKPNRKPSAGTSIFATRWGQSRNEWHNRLAPNSLLRTYQGYTDADLTTIDGIRDAQGTGRLVLTGVWLIDKVKESATTGITTLECRDIGALLLDQQLYPPLVPRDCYPLRFARWRWVDKKVRVKTGDQATNQRLPRSYRDSSEDHWYPDKVVPFHPDSPIHDHGRGAPVHGHYPADSIDDSQTSFWLSVGNSGPDKPFSYNWIEYDTKGQNIDAIDLTTWGSGYQLYISVWENGHWQGLPGGIIPYDYRPLIGHQPYVIDTGADIPYIKQVGIGNADGGDEARTHAIIPLGRTYKAERIRLTFTHLVYTQWGPFHYRAGVVDFAPVKQRVSAVYKDETQNVKVDGNYKDWSDIVKNLLLWSGWWLAPQADGNGNRYTVRYPEVYGNIESTGAYSEEALPADMFDKVPPMEAITKIKEVVGYHFWIGPEGEAHFECVDDRTEAFTRRGWVLGQDLAAGDEVLSLNPDSGLSEWVAVDRVARYDIEDQELVSIEGRVHSSLTTSNHRWWTTGRGRAGWQTSGTLNTESRIPIAAPRGDAPETAVHPDEFVELVAWWYTEGTICAGGRTGVISQSRRANPGYVDRIRRCFEKLAGPTGFLRDGHLWHEYPSAEEMTCWMFKGAIFDDLIEVAPDRVPTMDFLLSLTDRQARMFVATSVEADGHTWGGRYSEFVQKDPRRVASFESACVLAGLAFSTAPATPGRGIHRTKVLRSVAVKPIGAARNKGAATTVGTETYTGTVWCPQLPRNHTWLARRNGTVYFTGNSPNWWKAGNFDENGRYTTFLPTIDEEDQLTDLSAVTDAAAARSAIIISTEEPTKGFRSTRTTSYKPAESRDMLRGKSNPTMWVNGKYFLSESEQRRMAELIAMHIWFSVRTDSVDVPGNPLIDPNDQVRVLERVTADVFIHYVQGINSTMNLKTGQYTMSLTTNWLGDRDNWVARRLNRNAPNLYRAYVINDDNETWGRIKVRLEARYGGTFDIGGIQALNAARVADAGGLVRGLELEVPPQGDWWRHR